MLQDKKGMRQWTGSNIH